MGISYIISKAVWFHVGWQNSMEGYVSIVFGDSYVHIIHTALCSIVQTVISFYTNAVWHMTIIKVH